MHSRLRLRFRFGLRTMLLVMALVCIFVANITYRVDQQRRAVAFLKKYDPGGVVGYDRKPEETWAPAWLRKLVGDDYFVNVQWIMLHSGINSQRLPETIEHLQHLPKLEAVDLWETPITDDDFRELAKLTQITRLGLNFTSSQITGTGLKYLTSLNHLSELDLSVDSLANENMQYVPKLVGLKTLSVGSNRADDEGLCRLANCPRLETLSLCSCRCSNKGLAAIASIGTLKNLTFVNMSVDPRFLDSPLILATQGETSEGGQNAIEKYDFQLVPDDGHGLEATIGGVVLTDPLRDQYLLKEWLLKRRPGLKVNWMWIRG